MEFPKRTDEEKVGVLADMFSCCPHSCRTPAKCWVVSHLLIIIIAFLVIPNMPENPGDNTKVFIAGTLVATMLFAAVSSVSLLVYYVAHTIRNWKK